VRHTPNAAAATRAVHVARQPLYDRGGAVVGYELLFRETADDSQASRRSAYATSNVIIGAFADLGIANLVGDRLCFVNLTREFVTGELHLPFDPGQAVLEILETIEPDDAVVAGVSHLVGQGYDLALDDFVWDSGHERLLSFATYVKLEVAGVDPAELAESVRRCRQYPHLRLVAERLDAAGDHRLALDLGFNLFQGYVLARPQVSSAVGLSQSRLHRLRLMAALADSGVDVNEVVSLVSADPALSYRLLQATNNAANGLTGRVSSVHDAIVLLGLRRVCQWVTLMLVGDLAEANEDLVASTLIRARLCRSVAVHLSLQADAAFTVGLLSSIAEIVGEPVADLVQRLPLTEQVTSALTTGAGPLGAVLALVLQYEAVDVEGLADASMPADLLATAYLQAITWARKATEFTV
jgi:EAL and modified HD-GYP domain-containing signal transduction protein